MRSLSLRSCAHSFVSHVFSVIGFFLDSARGYGVFHEGHQTMLDVTNAISAYHGSDPVWSSFQTLCAALSVTGLLHSGVTLLIDAWHKWRGKS